MVNLSNIKTLKIYTYFIVHGIFYWNENFAFSEFEILKIVWNPEYFSLSSIAKYNRNSLASRHLHSLAADNCIILKVRNKTNSRNKQK